MNKALQAFLTCLAALLLAGCGGGGGDDGGSGSASRPPPTSPLGNNTIATAGANVQPVVVDGGPPGRATVNLLYTTIRLCAPGSTTNCQEIDHIQVDTGSSGLRVLSEVLSPALAAALTPQTQGGGTVAECMQFLDGFSWGPIRTADLHIADEQASGLPVQVIGDPSFAPVPADCASTGGTPENDVASFGAKGILGVGPFLQDCGPACERVSANGLYYICAGSTCQQATVAQSAQVANPAAAFSTDNNGVIIQLPAVAPPGRPTLSGSLVFGIGTRSNNGLGSAVVFGINPNNGTFTTSINGRNYPNSFIDSGSNGIFFSDSSIPTCRSVFYCPSSTLTLTAVNTGVNGATGAVDFTVADASALFANSSNAVLPGLAGTMPSGVDFGLPFFYGRNVFTAFEGRSTPGGPGPYFAY
jgi:hypothetical protein